VRRLHDEQKLGPATIAKQLGVGRAGVSSARQEAGALIVPIRPEPQLLYFPGWRDRSVRGALARGECPDCGQLHLEQLRGAPNAFTAAPLALDCQRRANERCGYE